MKMQGLEKRRLKRLKRRVKKSACDTWAVRELERIEGTEKVEERKTEVGDREEQERFMRAKYPALFERGLVGMRGVE